MQVQIAVLAKIISGLPDKMSSKPSMLCRTFPSSVGHYSQLITSNFFLSCQTFSMHLTLPDMSARILLMSGRGLQHWRTFCPAKLNA